MTTGTVRVSEVDRPPTDPHPTLPAWAADLIASVLIVTAALAPFPDEFRPTGWTEVVLVIVPAAVLPFRRRWPVPALVVCLALYGVTSALGVLSPGASLAVSIAMFGVANRSTRRTTIILGSITVVVVFVLSIPGAAGNVFDPRVFQFVLMTALAGAAGDAARSRRAYIAAITERAERAEQTREAEARRRVTEERLRIARDLHDAVAHQITVISLNAGVASSALPTDPDRAATALGTIRAAARTVLAEIGALLTMLRTDDADTHPTLTPQHDLDQLDELLDRYRRSGLEVHQRTDGDPGAVAGAVGLVGYRVAQESLANAHKHGAEHRAHVLLEIRIPGWDEVDVGITRFTRARAQSGLVHRSPHFAAAPRNGSSDDDTARGRTVMSPLRSTGTSALAADQRPAGSMAIPLEVDGRAASSISPQAPARAANTAP